MDVKTHAVRDATALRPGRPARHGWAARGAAIEPDGAAAPGRTPGAAAPRRRLSPVALPLTAATALGLALRLLVRRGLWLDEATSVAQARLPFSEMLQDLVTFDVHPPLHHALLWVWVRVFGHSEFAVRAPSVIAGTLLVPALYLLGRELYDRRTGLVAALLGAVAPTVVWYSQEARMYALWMLFVVVAVWAQSRALRRGETWPWAVYTLSCIALLWTHYFTVLLIGVQQLVFLAIAARRRRQGRPLAPLLVPWGLALVVIVLAVAPMLPYVSDQLVAISNTAAEKQEVLDSMNAGAGLGGDEFVYVAAANLVWALWGYHAEANMVQLVATWPLLMVAGLALLGRRRSSATSMLLALTGLPVATLFLLALSQQSLFELRYFMSAVPLLLVLVARAVAAIPVRGAGRWLALGGFLLTMLVGLLDQQLNPQVPRRYGFELALQTVAAQAGPGDVVLYEPWYLADLIDYYAPGMDAVALRDVTELPHTGAERVFVIGSFLEQPRHGQRVGEAVGALDYSRELESVLEDNNVKVWRFR